jgi:hypothetical protein
LEGSPDLKAWYPIANLLTTNSTGPFLDYPPSGALARFYRVRSPGVPVAEAMSAWDSWKPGRYRYRFQNTKREQGGIVLAGTVTISNGVKAVTEVSSNGLPQASFDPADFERVELTGGFVEDQ